MLKYDSIHKTYLEYDTKVKIIRIIYVSCSIDTELDGNKCTVQEMKLCSINTIGFYRLAVCYQFHLTNPISVRYIV